MTGLQINQVNLVGQGVAKGHLLQKKMVKISGHIQGHMSGAMEFSTLHVSSIVIFKG